MTKDNSFDSNFLGDAAAAMVDEAGVVIARDPNPVDLAGERCEQGPRVRRKPVASEPIVEAVAQAIKPLRATARDVKFEGRKGCDRIVRRKHLAEPGKPACFLKVQIRDKQ